MDYGPEFWEKWREEQRRRNKESGVTVVDLVSESESDEGVLGTQVVVETGTPTVVNAWDALSRHHTSTESGWLHSDVADCMINIYSQMYPKTFFIRTWESQLLLTNHNQNLNTWNLQNYNSIAIPVHTPGHWSVIVGIFVPEG